jgi:hypothetical protein
VVTPPLVATQDPTAGPMINARLKTVADSTPWAVAVAAGGAWRAT